MVNEEKNKTPKNSFLNESATTKVVVSEIKLLDIDAVILTLFQPSF